MKRVDPTSPPEEVRSVYEADWWPVASAITTLGEDCIILDPDRDETEVFFSGRKTDGTITVVPHAGLGWVLMVVQTTTEMLDDSDPSDG